MKNSEDNKKSNWPLVGNKHIVEFLSKSIENDKVSGPYIFLGPTNLGKTTLANYFAQILLCSEKRESNSIFSCGKCSSCLRFIKKNIDEKYEIAHGDFHLIKKEKDKKNISIEQIRDFIKDLGMSSFLNSYKIGIIKNAESLSIEASNALLKTFEEPRKKVIVVLVASNLDNIPKTITSRSKILNFYPVNKNIIYDYLIEEYATPRSDAKIFSKMCLGRPALAVKFLENKDFYEMYLKRINVFLNFYNQRIDEKLDEVNELIKKDSGQEAVKSALKIIESWEGVVRDLFLLNFGQNDLVQYEPVVNFFNKGKNNFKLKNLLEISLKLRESKNYLMANVNPLLVLENIAVSV